MKYKAINPIDFEQRKRDIDEFVELCRPVVEYIQKKWHPHTRIIIDWDRASVFTEECGIPFEVPDDGGIEQIVWHNNKTGEVKHWSKNPERGN